MSVSQSSSTSATGGSNNVGFSSTAVRGSSFTPHRLPSIPDELDVYGDVPEQRAKRLFSEVSRGVNYYVEPGAGEALEASRHVPGVLLPTPIRRKPSENAVAVTPQKHLLEETIVTAEAAAEATELEETAPSPSEPPAGSSDRPQHRGHTVQCASSAVVPNEVADKASEQSRPLLLDELDADLMNVIRRYYEKKNSRESGERVPHRSRMAEQAQDLELVSSESESASASRPVSSRVSSRAQRRLGHPTHPKASFHYRHASGGPRVSSTVDPVSSDRQPRESATVSGTAPSGRVKQVTHRAGGRAPPLDLPHGHAFRQEETASQPAAAGAAPHGVSAASQNTLAGFPTHSSTSFVRAYISETNLSLQPAVIVSGLAALMNIVAFYFLQHHVLDTRDHLGLFLIGSYLVFSSYYMIYYFLERFSASFRRIHSHDKKFYIIGNLLKAGVLISITPFAVFHLTKIIVFDEWQGETLQNLGCIYAIPDFISMIVVKRMRWSTWVHHACVVLFNYFSILNDYQNENVLRCVVVYASFSSFAYCVNVLLASRFLGMSPTAARYLSFIALLVYAGCCAVNWCWQAYYLHRLLSNGLRHWSVYVYMVLICLVMYDDMILNKWLLRYAQNTAFAASQMKRQQRQRRAS